VESYWFDDVPCICCGELPRVAVAEGSDVHFFTKLEKTYLEIEKNPLYQEWLKTDLDDGKFPEVTGVTL
jgi:hypothetical protein